MGDESEIVSLSEWAQIVARRLDTTQFDIEGRSVQRLLASGAFLGEHFLAEVTARLRRRESAHLALHFFLKGKPRDSQSQLALVEQTEAFEKETAAVGVIFDKFRSALRGQGEEMEWTCQCFYTRPDLVVLEDLTHAGYRASSFSDSLKFQHFALVMKTLANLHSACMIYEEKQPKQPYQLIDDYKSVLRETYFTDDPKYPGVEGTKAALRTMRTLIGLLRGKEAAIQMENKISSALNLIFKLQRPSHRFRNVVCQGDVKRENIFFLHEQDEPVDARLVDYQLIRYAPPANDIMCFLYLAADKAIRDKYASQLFATYYERVSQNLEKHRLDVDKIFPWQEFEESCKVYRTLGLVLSMYYCPITFMSPEFLDHVFQTSEDYDRFVNVDRSPEVIKAYESDKSYRERIRVVVDEFIQECVEKTPEI